MKSVLLKTNRIIKSVLESVVFVQCLVLSAMILVAFMLGMGNSGKGSQQTTAEYPVMDRFDMYMTNTLSDVLDGVLSIKKVYWLSDSNLVAPEPNQNYYGETDDPASLQWLMEKAQGLLGGQETLFSTDVQIMTGSKVMYYFDETILAITWKEVRDNSVYTMSEIKIADPSQFRRFLAGGEFGSSVQYVATEMATSVNAVVAANGDFYKFRNMGIIVYDSKLMRMEGYRMDSCLINENGDLQFIYAGQMTDPGIAEQFVNDNGVRFSVAFGPVLIDNGERCKLPAFYPVGEADIPNARAALCQMGELHYLLVAVSPEPPYQYGHTLDMFAKNLQELGCDKAYNLDGGQSATIVMNDKLVNYVYQRLISDIIYFATALPDGG